MRTRCRTHLGVYHKHLTRSSLLESTLRPSCAILRSCSILRSCIQPSPTQVIPAVKQGRDFLGAVVGEWRTRWGRADVGGAQKKNWKVRQRGHVGGESQ
jgi:hypothetical protein